MGGYAIAESLVWGDNTSEILKEEFDMIVLADCVYYEEVIYFIFIYFPDFEDYVSAWFQSFLEKYFS